MSEMIVERQIFGTQNPIIFFILTSLSTLSRITPPFSELSPIYPKFCSAIENNSHGYNNTKDVFFFFSFGLF
ncbi:hypothetical protein KSP40_PGU014744 [Platanthera guangdongensis]|uniref:Uncharacterized protein n=1 Tax=Platanthera guangdongensis TaxID=2320717 RepID=A0ABR2MHE4_9ASPA